MSKAWNLLSTEAQNYFNGLGEKQRRSGKGALESEIKRIKKFKDVKKEYIIEKDALKPETVKIILTGGQEFKIETVNRDGTYLLKDGNSVRNLLTGITAELGKENGY